MNELHHTRHISVFLVQFFALCPKPWHLKHCWMEGVILNSLTLKIMPVFWHISPPEISVSACFGLSLFIFINGRSLPVLFDFILSASAWVILLKSSSCLKSSSVMLLHTPLKTKILPFFASAEWYDLGSDILTFFLKTCCIFGSLCRMAKSLGVSPMKTQPFFVCLICKTLRFGWYCLSSLMILIDVLNFGSILVAISGVLFF